MSTVLKIKVLNSPEKENFYCQLCNYPLVRREDFQCNKEHECCHECFLTFAEPRKKEWQNGWRPEKSELDSYILLRNKNNRKEIR
jgi:hypothetical protein